MSVQSKSGVVNTSLFEKREHIEKLHRTRNLLRKVQVSNEPNDFFLSGLLDNYKIVNKISNIPTAFGV